MLKFLSSGNADCLATLMNDLLDWQCLLLEVLHFFVAYVRLSVRDECLRWVKLCLNIKIRLFCREINLLTSIAEVFTIEFLNVDYRSTASTAHWSCLDTRLRWDLVVAVRWEV